MRDERQRMWKLAARYMTVGIEMAVQLTIGSLGGLWLDNRLGTKPWLLWFGIVVGVGACVRTIARLIKGTHLNQL